MRLASHIVLLLLIVSLRPCAADENDRRHKYGNGLNNDGAAYIGDQKTKQQLTPNMMSHYAQSQMHFAMGNIPMGTVEQMKGNLLKAQIKENKRTADKNRESEKLLYDYQDTKVDLANADPNVRTVDKSRLSMKDTAANAILSVPPANTAATASAPPAPPESPKGAEQLAQLRSSSSSPTSAASSGADRPATTDAGSEAQPRESQNAASSANGASVADDSGTSASSSVDKSGWQADLEGLSKQGPSSSTLTAGTSAFELLPVIPQQRLLGAVAGGPKQKSKREKEEEDLFASIGKEDKDKNKGRDSSRARRTSRRQRTSSLSPSGALDRLLAGRP